MVPATTEIPAASGKFNPVDQVLLLCMLDLAHGLAWHHAFGLQGQQMIWTQFHPDQSFCLYPFTLC